ncbi:hypothetical protein [Streptomyces niveus]|uniref:hypothetical protein n=1 Tax=Streptomyces niveus TaxID=193462 RepID=UPI003434B149
MRARGAERGWDVVRRAGQWLRRARDGAGDERRSLLLTAKSVVAATVAWMLAYYLLDARSPAFAPFSAVLLMHVTIYRSLAQAPRYGGPSPRAPSSRPASCISAVPICSPSSWWR